MDILRYIFILVEILCCLLLIGVILLQQAKSQGMGVAFGGGMSETLFGSRAGNILTKTTIVLAVIFLANTTLLGIMYTTKREETSLMERATAPAPLPVSAPAGSDMFSAPPPSSGTFPSFDEQVAPVEPVATESAPESVVVPTEVTSEPVDAETDTP